MTIAAVSSLEVSHPEGWTWQPATRRYRDPATGRFTPNATVKGWRDTFLDRRQQAVRDLASALASGWITSSSWREQMGEIQRETYGIMAALGRGGLNAMQLEDWNRVNAQLARQQPFLERFTNDIESGGLSEDQIGARSELYVGTAVQAFEAGRAAAWGDPELPQLPGDGSTECGGNCRCHWNISSTDTGWECRWTGSNDERTCMGCATNQDTWDPLIIPYPNSGATLSESPIKKSAAPQSVIWNSESAALQSSRNYLWFGFARFELEFHHKKWTLIDNQTSTRERFGIQSDAKKRADTIVGRF